MNAKARAARQIIKSRRTAAADHKAGRHTLTSHALMAGVDAKDAAGIGNAIRAKAPKMGVTGCTAFLIRKTKDGIRPVKNGKRYTTTDVATLLTAYNPRAPKFVEAKNLMLAYVGA
jgi:hypothetical protein